jgi:hypothetical protein
MASDTSPAPSPPERPKSISRKKKSASQTEVLERAYAGKSKTYCLLFVSIFCFCYEPFGCHAFLSVM